MGFDLEKNFLLCVGKLPSHKPTNWRPIYRPKAKNRTLTKDCQNRIVLTNNVFFLCCPVFRHVKGYVRKTFNAYINFVWLSCSGPNVSMHKKKCLLPLIVKLKLTFKDFKAKQYPIFLNCKGTNSLIA